MMSAGNNVGLRNLSLQIHNQLLALLRQAILVFATFTFFRNHISLRLSVGLRIETKEIL